MGVFVLSGAPGRARSPAGPRPRPLCQVLPGGWGWSRPRRRRGGRTVGPVRPAGGGHARLRLARPANVFTARYAAGCCGLALSLRAQLGGRKRGKR